MGRWRTLTPLLLAALALMVTSVLAYADAGPKHKLSAENAAKIVSEAEDYANAHGGFDNHGGLVSSVAKNWEDFVDNLEMDLGGVNKGQVMRIIAQSHRGNGDEDTNDEGGNEEGATPNVAATLSASYASSPATSWNAGETKSYNVTVTNTGSATWYASGTNRFRLGIEFGTDSDTPGSGWATDQRFSLPNDVAPGGAVTLSVSVTAPTTAGSYVLRHRMVKEDVAWFDQIQKTNVTVGAAATVTPTPVTTAGPVTTATPVPSDRSGDMGNGQGRGRNK